MTCNKCEAEHNGIHEWQQHMAAHLMEIADREYGGWNGRRWWTEQDNAEGGREKSNTGGATDGSVGLVQAATPTPIPLPTNHAPAQVVVLGSSSESDWGTTDTGGSGYGRRGDTGHHRARGSVGEIQGGTGRPDRTGGTGSESSRYTITGNKGLPPTQGSNAHYGQVRKEICGGRQ